MVRGAWSGVRWAGQLAARRRLVLSLLVLEPRSGRHGLPASELQPKFPSGTGARKVDLNASSHTSNCGLSRSAASKLPSMQKPFLVIGWSEAADGAGGKTLGSFHFYPLRPCLVTGKISPCRPRHLKQSDADDGIHRQCRHPLLRGASRTPRDLRRRRPMRAPKPPHHHPGSPRLGQRPPAAPAAAVPGRPSQRLQTRG